MLTAIDDIDNKINALESACDDYVAKPFNSKELILRTQNLIKRNNVVEYDNSNLIQVNDLNFNIKTLSLKISGESISLSDQEKQILAIFMNNLNKILDKDTILKELNKSITQSNLNSLNVSILRLRKKIEPDLDNPTYIKTIRNKGFILNSK
jgi:two-component system phosphate regulon response regulator OmpR